MSNPAGAGNTTSNSAGSARGVHVPGGDQTKRHAKGAGKGKTSGQIPARSYPLPSARTVQPQAKPAPPAHPSARAAQHKPQRKVGR